MTGGHDELNVAFIDSDKHKLFSTILYVNSI